MTNLIRFSLLTLLVVVVLPSVAQYSSLSYPSWNRSSRQNFMAPMHLYDGVPLPRKVQFTAPVIETIRPLNSNYRLRNGLLVTRTTYYTHPVIMSTARTHKRYHFRRRNRTRTTRTTAATQASIVYPAPQQFGIVVNVYEPTEVYTPWPTTSRRSWWDTTSRTTFTFTTATTTTSRTTVTTTTATTSRTTVTTTATMVTTQSFYDRFPKLPSVSHRPPPPTVPRSFTASRPFTYPLTTTSTSTTTTSKRPPTPVSNSWLFTVPSFSKIIDQYPRYPTILRWFDELARHPNISRFFAYEIVGRTHENRSLIVAKIGLMPFRTMRRSVWVDGGIHAREWISTATVLYSMARLINGTLARDDDVRKLIDSYDFYFMPVVNPDGYVYTHEDVKKAWDSPEQQDQQRMWRKNRRPHEDCPGVDLNRNFPFAWDNRGASKFPCEETYRGPYPESEPEVRAITSFILKRRRHFYSFITLHAFGNLWMLPFSFSTRIRPYDYQRSERLLLQMNRLSSNPFRIGQSSTVLYPATGTSEDWAKAIAQIPHTFSVELPPSTDAFDMRQNELNGFTFYADKEISIVADSTYQLLHLYLRHLARLPSSSRITI